MRRVVLFALFVFAVGFASGASAVPIVSVDTDPGMPGVQGSSTVLVPSTFDVDIVISGVDVESWGAAIFAALALCGKIPG